MLFDHLNKFSKRTALISENLEKLSYSGLISRADKIGSLVTKKSLGKVNYISSLSNMYIFGASSNIYTHHKGIEIFFHTFMIEVIPCVQN